MYDAHTLLWSIDQHRVSILALFAVAMVLQAIAMVTAVRVSARDQVITVPLICTFLWFAHDLGVVVRFHDWFVTYDHWFLKCYWAGLASALLLEIVFLVQAVRYGHREFLPSGSTRAFAGLVVAGAIAAVAGWEYLKSFTADPLYQAMPALTLWALPLAGTAQMLRSPQRRRPVRADVGQLHRDGPVLVGSHGDLLRPGIPFLAVRRGRRTHLRPVRCRDPRRPTPPGVATRAGHSGGLGARRCVTPSAVRRSGAGPR